MRVVLVQCDCGVVKEVLFGNLRSNNPTRSCGCLSSEAVSARNKSHGLTGSGTLYDHIYWGMIQRCTNENNEHWKDYGGRGITVCDEWLNDPASFVSWAMSHGWKKGLSIDRIDNDAGYSPDNCRFTTTTIQNRNKRTNRWITFGNCRMLLIDWASAMGITYDTLYQRLCVLGWGVADALMTKPMKRGNQWTRKRITERFAEQGTGGVTS